MLSIPNILQAPADSIYAPTPDAAFPQQGETDAPEYAAPVPLQPENTPCAWPRPQLGEAIRETPPPYPAVTVETIFDGDSRATHEGRDH